MIWGVIYIRLTAELSLDSAAVYEPATSKLFWEGEKPSALFLLYRNCFNRIFYFSGNAKLDDNLKPIKKYCEEVLEQEEPCLYDTWDEAVLKDIISKQRQAVKEAKQAGEKIMPSALIVCDDMMDDKIAMGGGILQQIFTRGRHF